MKISAFTFLRNGVMLGYPFEESIRSVLPLVDEFVVALGSCEDAPRARIVAMGDAKIRIVDTEWNEAMQDRGFVYGQQKMIAQYQCSGDWAFYLEGDEVVHERDLPALREVMQKHLHNTEVEALVFDYVHFYGGAAWRSVCPGWYRRAPRIIRNTIRSYAPDGLFWVVMHKNKRGRYPRAALTGVPIYHYGFARSIAAMREKNARVGRYWGHEHPLFHGYTMDPQGLVPFSGEHPAVMAHWLEHEAEQGFVPDPNYKLTRRELRYRWKARIERWFGVDLTQKHFTLVR